MNYLDLTSTGLTDVGLNHLKAFTFLEVLWLPLTEVSDFGIQQLKGLPHLSRLCLTGTQVTEAGVRDLQRELPQLRILH